MGSRRTVSERVAGGSLRFALLVGTISIPPTFLLFRESVLLSFVALFLAGTIVGYAYDDRSANGLSAGISTGLVGSIGITLHSVDAVLWSLSYEGGVQFALVVVGLNAAHAVLAASVGALLATGWRNA